MWDYNIGLVRTTHLFKCMNHSKVGLCAIEIYGTLLTSVLDCPGQSPEQEPGTA